MDIDDSDRYVAAISSLGKACLYDRETKKVAKSIEQGIQGADLVKFIPGGGSNRVIMAGKSCHAQAFDIMTGEKLFDLTSGDSAGITDLSFQPLNDFCVFS